MQCISGIFLTSTLPYFHLSQTIDIPKVKPPRVKFNFFANCNLSKINIFHTHRENEFKNKIIDEVLETLEIDRSLSIKGCTYDNAVAEATYKIIKTEFAYNRVFNILEELQLELSSYVNCHNNHRIHGPLGYMTPEEYKTTWSE